MTTTKIIPDGTYYLTEQQFETEKETTPYYTVLQEPDTGLFLHVIGSADLDEIHTFICQADPITLIGISYCYISESINGSLAAWIERNFLEYVNQVNRI